MTGIKADIIQTHFDQFNAAVRGAERNSFFAGAAALWSVFQELMNSDSTHDESNAVFQAVDDEVQKFFMGVIAETAQAAAKEAGLNIEIEVVAERIPNVKQQVH